MEFEIWSIGDINMLATILNSVAAIAGTGMIAQLASIGMILGVIILGLQGVMRGQFFQVQNLIVGWIIFAFLFGPGVTVRLQDTYSLNEQTIDNVPFGVAAVGSFMSKIGHEITDTAETAFSLPTMTENGFATPIYNILKVRKLDLGPANYGGDPAAPSGDLGGTMAEYVKDCTIVGIHAGIINPDHVVESSAPWEAMKFNSNIYGTRTDIPGEGKVERTCSEAWTAIDNYLGGDDFWADWNAYLETYFGDDPVVELQNGVDALVGVGVDARKFMLTAVFRDAYERGAAKGQLSMGDLGGALITIQGREQRNVQWAAESSLFITIMKPMLAFFEGVFYAVTPFIAFLVVLVPMGIKTAITYVQMALWIQLWMPVMAFLNFYINYVAQDKITNIMDGPKIAMTSIAGMEISTTTMADWMATAGMLAASTPAITWMLMKGGSVAMTHLMGRLRGGDHIDEKALSPDVLKNGGVLGMNPSWSYDHASGLRYSGADPLSTRFSIGDDRSQAMQSAESKRAGASAAWNDTVRGLYGSSTDYRNSFGTRESLSQEMAAKDSQSSKFMMDVSTGMLSQLGLDTSQSSQFAGSLAGQLGTGQALPAALNTALQETFGISDSSLVRKAMDVGEKLTDGKGLEVGLAESLKHDVSDGKETFMTRGLNSSEAQELSQNYSQFASAEKSYQEVSSLNRSFGATTSQNAITLGHQIAKQGRTNDLLDLAGKYGLGDKVMNYSSQVKSSMGLPEQEALAAGSLMALNQYASSGTDSHHLAASEDLVTAIGRTMMHEGAQMGSPAANRNVGGDLSSPGETVRDKVNAANITPAGSPEELAQKAANLEAQSGQKIAQGPNAVGQFYDGRTRDFEENAVGLERVQKAKNYDSALQAVGHNLAQMTPAQMATETSMGFLGATRDAMTMGVGSLSEAFIGGAKGAYEGWKNKLTENFDASVEKFASNGGYENPQAVKELEKDMGAFQTMWNDFKGFVGDSISDPGGTAQKVWEDTRNAVDGFLGYGSAIMGGAISGAENQLVDFYTGFRDEQRAFADAYGLTPDQQELYAEARTDLLSRFWSAGGLGAVDFAQVSEQLRDTNEYEAKVGDPRISDAIVRAAYTGNHSYLAQVGMINKFNPDN